MVDPAHLANQKMKMPDLLGASPLDDGFREKQGGAGRKSVIGDGEVRLRFAIGG